MVAERLTYACQRISRQLPAAAPGAVLAVPPAVSAAPPRAESERVASEDLLGCVG
jgi:hypothetical protein